MNRDELVGAIELRLQNDALAHYGVKGSKWGYNKGRRNGKRTAGTVVSNLDEMNALRNENLKGTIYRQLQALDDLIKDERKAKSKANRSQKPVSITKSKTRVNADAAYNSRQKKVQAQLKKYIRQRNADAQTAGRAKRERARANSAVRKSLAGKARNLRRD